jgi:hypothetical protein
LKIEHADFHPETKLYHDFRMHSAFTGDLLFALGLYR